jgi:hypothetical protein
MPFVNDLALEINTTLTEHVNSIVNNVRRMRCSTFFFTPIVQKLIERVPDPFATI